MIDIINTALKAGEILLKNGSETYRIHYIMKRILNAYKIFDFDILVIGTGIVLTVNHDDQLPFTLTRTIKGRRKNNFNRITRVYGVVNQIEEEDTSVLEVYNILLEIEKSRTYKPRTKVLAMALGTSFFTLGFGGTFITAIVTLIITLPIAYVIQKGSIREIPFFLINIIMGAVITFASFIWARVLLTVDINLNVVSIMASVIIIMTPGLVAVNGFRDMVQGDFITGSARLLDAFIQAFSLAIGVGATLAFFPILFKSITL